jgi:hypothetical protein
MMVRHLKDPWSPGYRYAVWYYQWEIPEPGAMREWLEENCKDFRIEKNEVLFVHQQDAVLFSLSWNNDTS